MNIKKKIELILREPEHIRMRYVWGCVAASMIVISAVWIFSITSLFKKEKTQEVSSDIANLQQQLQDIKNQTPSLKDLTSQPLTLDSEGVANTQPTSDPLSPDSMDSSEPPQSTEYPSLQDNSADTQQ